ncbi:MAG: aspartate aminotransferase family protein [Solirubrobacteraceae bacterium]
MSDPEGEKPQVREILGRAAYAAHGFLDGLGHGPGAPRGRDEAAETFGSERLPQIGVGGANALDELVNWGVPAATRSAGPRFFHFVTGGATPAALAADWLTSTLDQNAFSWVSSPLGSRAEQVAVSWLKELFELPAEWGGVITTGATMANFTALAAARHWWARQLGRDIDADGFSGLPELPVLSSGYVHTSVVKALTMLGLGRNCVRRVTSDAVGRVDLEALEDELRRLEGRPAVLVATAGEVNAGDFDPVGRLADLAERYGAWLHVDGAFGLFARVSTEAAELGDEIERADSVISDGHKWLNVPYDCGFAFVRDPELLSGPFAATGAAYLPVGTRTRPSFGDRGPELSRRARALPVWATLKAYGRTGYQEMVDRHIRLARRVGQQVQADPDFELLAPVTLNVVCFRYRPRGVPQDTLDDLNARLAAAIQADGRVFFGTTTYGGQTAFRPAISNWRTTEADVDLIIAIARELGGRLQGV